MKIHFEVFGGERRIRIALHETLARESDGQWHANGKTRDTAKRSLDATNEVRDKAEQSGW